MSFVVTGVTPPSQLPSSECVVSEVCENKNLGPPLPSAWGTGEMGVDIIDMVMCRISQFLFMVTTI